MLLTPRQERILKTIVDLYIGTARPVGSSAVVHASGLDVSSATVRNEMAALEDLGYVRQLHTSGGRVPTDAGYRYYVERLMSPGQLSSSEAITIRHQFHQAHTELQEWLKLAATIMALRLHNVGLVTAPKSTELRLRHLEVISIQHAVTLLIVVLADGIVLQEMLTLAETVPQETLSALSDHLSGELRGMTAGQIVDHVSTMPVLAQVVARATAYLLSRTEARHTPVYHAGLADLIRQPEFSEPRHGESPTTFNERVGQMVEFLHRDFAVERIVPDPPPSHDVRVVIGSDMGADELRDYSFVLGRYGSEGEGSGFLGVVGPTRMAYPRAVALVRYMSELMTDLMETY